MLIPLKIPPGVVRRGTEYQSAGRWYDVNLVRWVDGILQPIGGWQVLKDGSSPPVDLQVTGKARGSHAWVGTSSASYLAIGTHSKLYAFSGTALFDITPSGLAAGREDSANSGGYGYSTYGYGSYGTPRTTAALFDTATTWTLDNFGNYLLGIHSDDGRLFVWQNSYTTAAAPVTASAGTVPSNSKAVVVTEERFVFVLAADGNPRLVRWCDQEDYTNWAVTATTQAGDFELQTSGRLRAGKKIRGGVLLWTEDDVHLSRYIGPPLVYGFERLATGCGIISPHAAQTADGVAYWLAEGGFFAFDGAVRQVQCDVWDYLRTRINRGQADKIHAVRVPDYGEIQWFYPSTNSTEIDSYVLYNYQTGVWSMGACARTTGLPKGAYSNQLYVAPNGKIYEHEIGNLYSGDTPHVQSGPVEVMGGEQVLRVSKVIPDERSLGDLSLTFKARLYPTSEEVSDGPYTLTNPTSVRVTGRQFSVRLDGAEGVDWRLGDFRVAVKALGAR